ncbi:MAG: hypothetical protein GVY20_03580, partial [Bacteroidetes bacterium]|nr:hypothetical protein [Bacteroidota bacterium]
MIESIKYKNIVIPGLTRNLLTFCKNGDFGSWDGITAYSSISFPSLRFILFISTLAILTLLLSIPKTYAQDTGSGLDFLNIGPSSRMLSLSEATTATVIGPSAIYSNPSLLVFDDQSSLDVSYTLWIANVNNQFAAMNLKRDNRAFAFGVYSSGSDGFEARDQPGPSVGNFSIRYLSLAGAVAQKLGPLSMGVTG